MINTQLSAPNMVSFDSPVTDKRKPASYEETELLAQRFVGQLFGRFFDSLFEASEVMNDGSAGLFRTLMTDALGEEAALSGAGQELVDTITYQMLCLQEGKASLWPSTENNNTNRQPKQQEA